MNWVVVPFEAPTTMLYVAPGEFAAAVMVRVEVAVPFGLSVTDVGFNDAVGQLGPGQVPEGPPDTDSFSESWPEKLLKLARCIVEVPLLPRTRFSEKMSDQME